MGGGATEEEVSAEIIVIKIEDTEIGTIEEEPEVQCVPRPPHGSTLTGT